jgi:hypothetical protein
MMLPATVFGLQCAKPFDSNYECYTYDSLLTGTDGRIENWQRCPIEDSNIPRPMGCVCGNVCPVDSCVNSKSGHLVCVCVFVCVPLSRVLQTPSSRLQLTVELHCGFRLRLERITSNRDFGPHG